MLLAKMRALLIAVALCTVLCSAYKPVLMFHGYGGTANDFSYVLSFIEKYHPGTLAVSMPLFEGSISTQTTLWAQIDGVRDYIQKLSANYSREFSDGFHLMCHSQGALVCRGYVMTTASHGVDTYVSLSGPHMGQYGIVGDTLPNITTENAWQTLYTPVAQAASSVAGYWNDPFHQAEFLKQCLFLPVLNNLTTNPLSQQYKTNFLETKTVALFGSPGDGIILPWESAFFGFWQANDNTTIVPMEDQPLYVDDYFGLRTLASQHRLVSTAVPGAYHSDWLVSVDLFTKYLEPLLT